MEIQVEKNHYDFKKYVSKQRWNSYYHQIVEASDYDSGKILYIGAGDNIVVNVLKDIGKNVTTFDFDENLNPDITGSVTEIDKVLNKKYDTIMCCQVLEHIPFDKFDLTLESISKCVNNKLILSLPNRARWFKFYISLPKIHIKKQFKARRIFAKKWDINKQGKGEHYWEIDAKGEGYSKKNVERIIKKHFKIVNSYVPFENDYHIFYILEPNNK